MAWGRLDDNFDDHPKVMALLENEQGAAAIGLWTLCLTAASRQCLAVITPELAMRLGGTRARAELLVMAGLWAQHDDGWTMVPDDALFRRSHRRHPVATRRGWWISPHIRREIYQRDGFRCRGCGSRDDLTLDHIHPRSLGGSDAMSNLRTLCRRCNSRKGARILWRGRRHAGTRAPGRTRMSARSAGPSRVRTCTWSRSLT